MNHPHVIDRLVKLQERFDKMDLEKKLQMVRLVRKKGTPNIRRAFESRFRNIQKLRQLQKGSALLVALVFSMILGLILFSCLAVVEFQNRISNRSQAWNSCLPLAEAGVELAFAEVNSGSNWNFTAGSDGWTPHGSFIFSRQQNLGEGSFEVWITNNVWSQRTNVVFSSCGSIGDISRTLVVSALCDSNGVFRMTDYREPPPPSQTDDSSVEIHKGTR